MTTGVRRIAPILGVAALGISALVIVRDQDPEMGGMYPVCVSALVGIACPLCGGLRATHDLMRGDFASMLDHNALLPLYLVAMSALFIGWAWTRIGGRRMIVSRNLSRMVVALAIMSVSFGVLRNFIPYLAPGAG